MDIKEKMYETSHAVWELFNRLDEKDLETISNLILAVAQGQANSTASYYNGFIDSLLSQKYSVCPTCNVAHDPSDHEPFNLALMEKMAKVYGAEGVKNFTETVKMQQQQAPVADEASLRPGTYL